jgi:hypothetical protein
MMSRDIMQRQMFAKGGAAFPDMSGDGRVTQKDILMGRGVIPMQEGGMAPMMPPGGAMMGVSSVPDEQAMMMGEQAMDPAMLEGALSQVASNIENIDTAEDYESVMNAIRGDNVPLEGRYNELAGVVGEEDAGQTPESVLALVQPVMMMAAVDQGIGGLAAEEMTAPVEGAMAEGIMSTVAPPPQPEMMAAPPAAPGPMMDPAMMGGPPPVNFNQGGLVRRGDNQPVIMMQTGGDPIAAAGRLGELYEQKMPLYKSILGDQSASLEEQKNLTQAQMLFDVAGAALAYANPLQAEIQAGRKLSPAERLAAAVTETKLLPTIGARAQQQLDAKKAVTSAEQQMKLSALGAAETGLAAEAKAAADLAQTKLKGAQEIASIELKDALDTKRDLTVQGDLYGKKSVLQQQKFALQNELNTADGARRLEIETELKGIDLESNKVMESIKANNKKALQETIADQNTQLAILKSDRRFATDTALQNSAAKISENLKILDSNLRLGEMGVANEFDLEKLSLTQGFERELNNTNNALKENLATLDRDLAERRLSLDNLKAQVAAAQGEEKLRLQAEVNSMTAEMNAFEQGYKTDKLELERAAARLTRLGSNTNARITTLLSEPERLAKYAAGTLSPEETLEMNQAIAYYNAPKQVWNDKEKRFVLSPGNPLSNELNTSIQLRQNKGLTIPNIKFEGVSSLKPDEEQLSGVVESLIMKDVEMPTAGFGSGAFIRDLANTVGEAFLLGAPATKTKDAVAATETLNTKFLQVFQRSAELRDTVFQAKEIKKLQPKPAKFWSGEEAAQSQIKGLLGMIGEAKQSLNQKLDELPLDSKQYTEAKGYLLDMDQLEAGYKIFQNYGQALNSKTNQQKVDEASNFLFGGER